MHWNKKEIRVKFGCKRPCMSVAIAIHATTYCTRFVGESALLATRGSRRALSCDLQSGCYIKFSGKMHQM